MDHKISLRVALRRKLQELDEDYLLTSNQEIYNKVLAMPEFLAAKNVFIYYSVGREIDTHDIINYCVAAGKVVALPVVLGGGIMEFAKFEKANLVSGSLNIPQPDEKSERICPTSDDIIIVPAISYDKEGYRLGQGGGYYDRFLSTTTAQTIGLCRELMLSDSLPRDLHDIPVNIIVTENRKTRLLKEPRG